MKIILIILFPQNKIELCKCIYIHIYTKKQTTMSHKIIMNAREENGVLVRTDTLYQSESENADKLKVLYFKLIEDFKPKDGTVCRIEYKSPEFNTFHDFGKFQEEPVDFNKIVFGAGVSCFDCPSCKKTVLYHYDDDWNYCSECDKTFTQDEIDNGEVESEEDDSDSEEDDKEECDRCGYEDVSWCMSNGCDKGKQRLEHYEEVGIIKKKKLKIIN